MKAVLGLLSAVLLLPATSFGQTCTPWQAIPSPDAPAAEATYPRAIHAASPNDVWVVGESLTAGQIRAFSMHWNGTSWTTHAVRVPDGDFADYGMWAVARSPSGEWWAAGHREFTPASVPYAFFGSHNAVWRWDGSEWQLMATPELGGGSGDFIWGLTALADNEVWFVGDHHPQPMGAQPALAMRWDGAQFTITEVPIVNPESGRDAGNPLNDISAITPDDIWAVGATDETAQGSHDYSNIQHWDGARWTHVPGPTPGFFNELFTVTAIASNNVWAAGEYWDSTGIFPFLLRWDGTAWTEQPNPGGFRDMVALGPDDVWAVGGNAVYHYDGAAWSVAATFPEFPDARLASISPASSCELWATGQQTTHSLVVRGSGGAGNVPPISSFTFSCHGLTCSFDGTGSSDAEGAIAEYYWSFGDSAAAAGPAVSHTYLDAGTYNVTLTVTDNGGARASSVQEVTVSSITLQATPYTRTNGQRLVYLRWRGARGANVEVYRNGRSITITANDGAYTDRIGRNGARTFVYRVCEPGNGLCSSEVTVQF